MITKARHLSRITFACLLWASFARAGQLDDIFNGSDRIVVGTVTSRDEGPRGVTFDISVERVLKGDPTVGIIHVSHAWTRPGHLMTIGKSQGTATLVSGLFHGIWCLRGPASSALYDVIPHGVDGLFINLYWDSPAALPQVYQSQNATGSDALVYEIAAGIEASGQRPQDLTESIGPVKSPAVLTVVANDLSSATTGFRSAALALGLMNNSPGVIAQLANIWPSVATDPSSTQILSALREFYRDSTPTSVLQLAQLASASSTSKELRTAAVWAISAIHTREALPFLAGLLSSADLSEQTRGIFGLGSFVNGYPSQTAENVASMQYLQNTPNPLTTSDTKAHFIIGGNATVQELAPYTAYWIAWWNKNNDAVTAQ